jgi:hypothetical protein
MKKGRNVIMNRKSIIKPVKISLFLILIVITFVLYKSIISQESIYTNNDIHSDSLYEDNNPNSFSMKLSSDDLSLLYKTNDWISIEMLDGTKSYSVFMKQSSKGYEAYKLKMGNELYTLYNINNDIINKLALIDMFDKYNIEVSKPNVITLSFNEVDMGKYILEKCITIQKRENNGNYYISLENDTMLTRQIQYNIDSEFTIASDFFEVNSLSTYLAINKLLGNNNCDSTLFRYNNNEKKLSPYINIETCPNYINNQSIDNEENKLAELYNFHEKIREEVDNNIIEMMNKDKLINIIEEGFNKYEDVAKPNSIIQQLRDIYNETTLVLTTSIEKYREQQKNETGCRYKFFYNNQWEYIDVSHSGGFYTQEFQLRLSTLNDCKIYYTLDGSYPTNRSNLYDKPITIKNRSIEQDKLTQISDTSIAWKKPKTNSFKGTVVRSIVYHNDKPISDVMTNTYFVDKDIYNSYSLPVVSLVTDKNNLFDYNNGIYVLGRRRNYWLRNNAGKPINNGTSANYTARGKDWERPIHIEWYEQDGELGFSQNLGVRMNGGWSRSYPMKPMKLYARSEYDDNKKIKYNIFDDLQDAKGNNIEEFKTFLLRNSGHDFLFTMFEDAMIHRLAKGTNVNAQAYKPVIVFINGEYWGIHNARERQDKDYIKNHYNIEEEDIILFENRYNLLHGKENDENRYLDIINYLKTHNIKDDETYSYIETKIDIDNYIDYYIIETYIVNLDWQTNNVKFWCKRSDEYVENAEYGHDGRFRWLLFDTESGFKYYDYNMIAYTIETGKPNAKWATVIFRTLLKNTEFRNKFITRYADLLNTNFKEDRVVNIIDEMKATIQPMINEHINRWTYPSSIDKWSNNVEVLREFAQKRPSVVRRNLSNYYGIKIIKGEFGLSDSNGGYIEVNGIKIDISDSKSFKGYYFEGLPISIKVVVNDGYEFTGFEGIEVSGDEITITPSENFILNGKVKKKN